MRSSLTGGVLRCDASLRSSLPASCPSLVIITQPPVIRLTFAEFEHQTNSDMSPCLPTPLISIVPYLLPITVIVSFVVSFPIIVVTPAVPRIPPSFVAHAPFITFTVIILATVGCKERRSILLCHTFVMCLPQNFLPITTCHEG